MGSLVLYLYMQLNIFLWATFGCTFGSLYRGADIYDVAERNSEIKKKDSHDLNNRFSGFQMVLPILDHFIYRQSPVKSPGIKTLK